MTYHGTFHVFEMRGPLGGRRIPGVIGARGTHGDLMSSDSRSDSDDPVWRPSKCGELGLWGGSASSQRGVGVGTAPSAQQDDGESVSSYASSHVLSSQWSAEHLDRQQTPEALSSAVPSETDASAPTPATPTPPPDGASASCTAAPAPTIRAGAVAVVVLLGALLITNGLARRRFLAFAAAAYLAAYGASLAYFACGRLGRLRPQHAYYAWPFCFGALLAGELLLLYVVDDSRRVECPRSTILGAESNALAAVCFLMLLLSELSALLFAWLGDGELFGYMRQPVLAVHAASAAYYFLSANGGLVCIADQFGRPLSPLRSSLWLGSVTCMVCAVHYVVDQRLLVLLWQLGPNAEAELAALHRNLQHAVAAVATMITCGLLASWPWQYAPASGAANEQALLYNVIFLAGAWGSFYWLLFHVCSMLSRVVALVDRLKGNRTLQGVGRQFRTVRASIVITWHSFGVTWLLGACKLVTPAVELTLYVFSDLAAKYILMFVYVAQGGVANTREA